MNRAAMSAATPLADVIVSPRAARRAARHCAFRCNGTPGSAPAAARSSIAVASIPGSSRPIDFLPYPRAAKSGLAPAKFVERRIRRRK
jgi:hypothetical protein